MTFSPFEIVGGTVMRKEDSVHVVELAHLNPEAIPAADAVVMLQAHGIPCKLRFLVGKTPRGIRLTKLPNAKPIPADKRGYVSFPLVEHVIAHITRFETAHRRQFGTEYEYLIDSQLPQANDP